jgi:hypothetical protein
MDGIGMSGNDRICVVCLSAEGQLNVKSSENLAELKK